MSETDLSIATKGQSHPIIFFRVELYL